MGTLGPSVHHQISRPAVLPAFFVLSAVLLSDSLSCRSGSLSLLLCPPSCCSVLFPCCETDVAPLHVRFESGKAPDQPVSFLRNGCGMSDVRFESRILLNLPVSLPRNSCGCSYFRFVDHMSLAPPMQRVIWSLERWYFLARCCAQVLRCSIDIPYTDAAPDAGTRTVSMIRHISRSVVAL